MFAGVGARDDHGVDVKCPDPETAQMVIEMGHGLRAKYLHASWVTVPFGLVGDDELRERILTSYQLIRAKLPRKVQAGLGAV